MPRLPFEFCLRRSSRHRAALQMGHIHGRSIGAAVRPLLALGAPIRYARCVGDGLTFGASVLVGCGVIRRPAHTAHTTSASE